MMSVAWENRPLSPRPESTNVGVVEEPRAPEVPLLEQADRGEDVVLLVPEELAPRPLGRQKGVVEREHRRGGRRLPVRVGTGARGVHRIGVEPIGDLLVGDLARSPLERQLAHRRIHRFRGFVIHITRTGGPIPLARAVPIPDRLVGQRRPEELRSLLQEFRGPAVDTPQGVAAPGQQQENRGACRGLGLPYGSWADRVSGVGMHAGGYTARPSKFAVALAAFYASLLFTSPAAGVDHAAPRRARSTRNAWSPRGAPQRMASVTFDGRSFQIDGRRVWVVGGSVQHGRIPPELWEDRLHAARLAGLNTVETSVLWNAVEPRPGQFEFEGSHDLRAFVEMAGRMGLHVIVRVGPFTGRGWDTGGLPAWLLENDEVQLRASNAPFLEAVSRYFAAVADQVRDLQVTATGVGGAVLAVQVEHSWTCADDVAGAYLGDLSRYLRESGINVPVINSNNLWQGSEGQIDGWIGDRGMFALSRQLGFVRPGQPRLIIEFGDGSLPRVGEPAGDAVDPFDLQRRLAEATAAGGQWCVAPFLAPSTFGFWGGTAATGEHRFLAGGAAIDAPLLESGLASPSYGPVRRLATFATRFARVLASHDPEYRPVVQAPALSHTGPVVAHLNGTQGSVAFVFWPTQGKSRAQTVELLRPNGTPLTVHAGKQRVSWCLLDVHLGGHATLDYCGLNVLDATGEMLVCFGAGGTVGSLAINGTPVEIEVPKGRKPTVELVEGVTVVVVSEDVVDQTFMTDRGVVVGVESVTTDGTPIPLGKQYTVVSPDGKTKTTAGTRQDAPGKVSLGAWELADIDEHIRGESPRFAGIDGPAPLADLGTARGYGWYRVCFKQAATKKVRLAIPESGDRVHVLSDGELLGVLGEGPGAAPDASVSLKKGDRSLVLLADNMGRGGEGEGLTDPKGVFGPIYETAPMKLGKPEVVESEPVSPLAHKTPLMFVRATDATYPERVCWKFMHRKKSPLHVSLGPTPVRGALLINGEFAEFLEEGGRFRATLDEQRLTRGNNTIEFAPLDEPAPDSTMAKLASALGSVLTVSECVTDLTAKADWGFAKWEPPQDVAYDAVPKTRLGDRALPSWWRCPFEVTGPLTRPVRLSLTGMTKGQVYINGENLGRYFVATGDGTAVPPESAMWIPEPLLREGANELVIFDEHGGNPSKVKLTVDTGPRPIVARVE
jgi:hypothetical protein